MSQGLQAAPRAKEGEPRAGVSSAGGRGHWRLQELPEGPQGSRAGEQGRSRGCAVAPILRVPSGAWCKPFPKWAWVLRSPKRVQVGEVRTLQGVLVPLRAQAHWHLQLG